MRRWLMRPIRALNDLRQWGQDSPVAACCGGFYMGYITKSVTALFRQGMLVRTYVSVCSLEYTCIDYIIYQFNICMKLR